MLRTTTFLAMLGLAFAASPASAQRPGLLCSYLDRATSDMQDPKGPLASWGITFEPGKGHRFILPAEGAFPGALFCTLRKPSSSNLPAAAAENAWVHECIVFIKNTSDAQAMAASKRDELIKGVRDCLRAKGWIETAMSASDKARPGAGSRLWKKGAVEIAVYTASATAGQEPPTYRAAFAIRLPAR